MEIAGSRQLTIAAPADRLWQMVADVTRMGSWSPVTIEACWLPPATGPAVGARFAGTNRLPLVGRFTSTATITDCQPGEVFGFVVGRDPSRPNSRWTYRFEPADGGTTVTESWEMIREPWIVLAYYRLVDQRRRVAEGVEQTLARLKVAAEGDRT